ncbi:MAG: MarR family transcriptional regulator [Ramlibacter sp.]|nr:MarR family transcriptional regulator [Ramlibacter sp.]
MLLYRINRLRAVGGGMVLRYCEGQFGVTRREWVMLALLSSTGPVSSSELAAHAELDKSATSKAVTALVDKGLMGRTARAGDRRYAQLELTAAGRDLHDRILPVVEGINRELMSALSADEVAQLDDLLSRIQQRADDLWREGPGLPRADRRNGGTRLR